MTLCEWHIIAFLLKKLRRGANKCSERKQLKAATEPAVNSYQKLFDKLLIKKSDYENSQSITKVKEI